MLCWTYLTHTSKFKWLWFEEDQNVWAKTRVRNVLKKILNMQRAVCLGQKVDLSSSVVLRKGGDIKRSRVMTLLE